MFDFSKVFSVTAGLETPCIESLVTLVIYNAVPCYPLRGTFHTSHQRGCAIFWGAAVQIRKLFSFVSSISCMTR